MESTNIANWEVVKVILDFFSSLFVLIGIIIASWKGFAFFKYKIDADTRNLYINNANEVDKIMGIFYANGHVEWNHIFELNKSLRNASLYLHKDVVTFIEKLKKDLCDLTALNHQLETLDVGDVRSDICDKIYKLQLKIDKSVKNFYQIYRNQILDDGFKIKDLKFWNKEVCKNK